MFTLVIKLKIIILVLIYLQNSLRQLDKFGLPKFNLERLSVLPHRILISVEIDKLMVILRFSSFRIKYYKNILEQKIQPKIYLIGSTERLVGLFDFIN